MNSIMERKYYICYTGGEPHGPYTLTELKAMKLIHTTLVKKEGFEKWVSIQEETELRELWGQLIQIHSTPTINSVSPVNSLRGDFVRQEVDYFVEYRDTNKKHGVPAIISFFLPGVGQLVKGHIGKAFLVWILLITASVMFVTGGMLALQQKDDSKAILGLLGMIAIPIIFIWNVYDAYNSN